MNDKAEKATDLPGWKSDMDPEPDITLPIARYEAEAPAEYDPLRRYLYEIGKYDLLSREEEFALGVRVHDEKDQEAALQMVTANMRLVVKIAMDFHHYWMRNLLDLIQEGNVGLIQAVRKFDPHKGVKFSYYASFWIKAYILKYILDNWHLVRLGTTQAQRKLFFNLKKEKELLLSQGFEPGPKLLAERLNVREKDVVEMDRRLDGWEVSLDAPIGRDSEESFSSFIASDIPEADDVLADGEIREIVFDSLEKFKKTLKERDLDILENRVLSEKPKTLHEMGEKYEISRERVRQIENRIKQRFKEYILSQTPEISRRDILGMVEGDD